MEWYKRKPQSYRSDTWGLTLAEHGAYNLLIDYYYTTERPLPKADEALASICGCPIDKWLEVKDNVTRYFRVTNAGLRHNTCDEVIDAALGSRTKDRERQKRFRKHLKPNGSVTPLSRVSHGTRGEEIREDSVAKATAQNDLLEPLKAIDPAKMVFDTGKALLKRYSIGASTAGGIINKWRKSMPDAELISIIAMAGAAERSDIVAFITGCIKERTDEQAHKVNGGSSKAPSDDLLRRFEQEARERRERLESSRSGASSDVLPPVPS
jgi:uncharacterized protein YdaU (DUF1376 family)